MASFGTEISRQTWSVSDRVLKICMQDLSGGFQQCGITATFLNIYRLFLIRLFSFYTPNKLNAKK